MGVVEGKSFLRDSALDFSTKKFFFNVVFKRFLKEFFSAIFFWRLLEFSVQEIGFLTRGETLL